ncbi:MAG TPA: glycine--tRNA ligase subunit beta, partial [bacterium (Candidatus Stahlbacteria)]|nr:glycine--tRNA ligase subunit beta [Candidatus Stahlbacteria bacterium]
NGKPTRLLEGFLKNRGLTRDDIKIEATERGRYVFAHLIKKGRKTPEVIATALPEILKNIESPKAMVWNHSRFRFIRPIRWLVALFDQRVFPLDLAGIRSSNRTRGPLTGIGSEFRLRTGIEYEQVLKRTGIIVDPEKRVKKIKLGIARELKKIGGKPVIDEELLRMISGMVERPLVASGTIDPGYLKLPEPILIRVIRDLQHCIPIRGRKGIKGRFLVVLDGKDSMKKNAIRGYEQVMKARLADAQFYYENDLKTGLEPLVPQEKDVVWLEGKGNLLEKTERLIKITAWLGKRYPVDLERLMRAAYLSKADLLTSLVREKDFTPLQGIAGAFYARALGEDRIVAKAIGEQYLPKFAGDRLPETDIGAILSLGDRIDNILAGFAIGRMPSGSEDPLALRRQAYGVIEIMVDKRIEVSLKEMVEFPLSLYPELKGKYGPVLGLFRERLRRFLIDQGFRFDLVEGIIDVCDIPYDTLIRARHLTRFRRRKDFEVLVIGQKRLANILKGIKTVGDVEEHRFCHETERALFRIARNAEPEVMKGVKNKDYDLVLKTLIAMRPTIDRFFDDVLVMHEDQDLRKNRLALVSYVRSIYNRFANFSKLTGGEDAQG